jgi:methyltransferase OMS1, mitochondrial
MLRSASSSRYVVTSLRRASTAAAGNAPKPRKPAKPQPIDPAHPLPEQPRKLFEAPASGKGQKLPYFLSWAGATVLGFYCLQLGVAASKPCTNPNVAELSQQKDVAARYNDTAESFDTEVGMSELLMGINGIRKRLAQKCKGHVLEVSCGTGRNLGYYDIAKDGGQVESLTFVDLSPQMVEVCKRRWDAFYSSKRAKDGMRPDLVVRFLPGSALDAMPLAPSGKKYDTIIQTMGLCSTASPVELLKNMVKHLDTSNPESRILLLEHGRSYMPWMNRILDNSAERHAEIHGCWFNREIGELVEQAAEQTGLEVVNERRHHFGTTWVFELKPKAGAIQAVKQPEPGVVTDEKSQKSKDLDDEPKAAGWFDRWKKP